MRNLWSAQHGLRQCLEIQQLWSILMIIATSIFMGAEFTTPFEMKAYLSLQIIKLIQALELVSLTDNPNIFKVFMIGVRVCIYVD